MRQFGQLKYRAGARWRCERSNQDPQRYSFVFVIVGPGSKSDRKLCRVEWDEPNQTNRQNFECEYSHKHLNKYAVYQEIA